MPERYDINGNPIGFFSVEDEGMRYVDPTVIQPAVVSANRGYWEAQKWARENVRDPRERTAPYVAAGLGATMAAPAAIDLAASGLASAAADPLWKAAAKRMAIDLPAFEAIDRLPQAWGDDRFTAQGTNLIKQTTPIGQFAPWAVDAAGPFITGMVPGMAGDMMVRGTAAGVNGVLNGIARRTAANRMGYLGPMADVLNTETTQRFEIPNRVYVEDPATHEISLMDAARANQLVEQGLPEQYIHTTVPGVDPAIELDLPFVTDHPVRVQRPTDVEAELNRLVNARRIPRGNAEFTPEETARLQAMIGDHPTDLANYMPEQIVQAQAQMRVDAPIIHDALAGNRAIPVVEQTLLRQPVMDAAMPNGYQIARYPGGYMLKSLMSGNPLEKQIGKNGTVNVNNIKALISKGSKVEQAVIDKVLASEEFAGQKAIDYNKFRKAVQDELITYDRTPDTRWKDYGMQRIGLSPYDSELESDYEYYNLFSKFIKEKGYTPVYNQAGLDSVVYETPDGKYIGEKELEDIFRNSFSAKAETFTFSSSRIPYGSGKHYDPNTLGHSRTYTTSDEPDVLHVMESQSDWAQSYKDKAKERSGRKIQEIEATLDEIQKRKLMPQADYLADNYTSRQIQENLRYAAEKGQKKMRYPTRETAAKIEGYPEQTIYYDKNGFEVKDPYEYPEEVANRIAEIQNEIDRIDIDDLDTYAPFRIEEEAFAWGDGWETKNAKMLAKLRDSILKDRDSLYQMRQHGDDNSMVETRLYENEKLFNKMLSRYNQVYGRDPELDVISAKSRAAKARRAELAPELKDLLSTPMRIKKHLIPKKVYSHEDILKKYTAFPKQYQKLYKNADVRTVTDSKGNTWYEVDVPENYLQQEWPYKNGGLLDRLNKHYNGDRAKIVQAMQYARGGFKRDDVSKFGHKFFDIVRLRYLAAKQALENNGTFTKEEIDRLVPIMVLQNATEADWRLDVPGNNIGGMMTTNADGSQTRKKYDSLGDYYLEWLDMMDTKFGDERFGSGKGWRSAKDADDYARIINLEDQDVTTKAKWNAYKKTHPNSYLYAPQWDNGEKTYSQKMAERKARTDAYLKMVMAELGNATTTGAIINSGLMDVLPISEKKTVTTEPVAPQMSPAPQQSSQPLGLFRSLIPTSVQQKMPAAQGAPVQQQAPLLRSLIPTSVQKKMNDRAAGGLIERYGADKVRAAMQKVKR